MTYYTPLELDTATSPATPRRPPAGKQIDPSKIDDATILVGGKMSPADKAALNATPAAIAAAVAAADATAEHVANKNAANGYAGLTAAKFVPAARISKLSARNMHLVDGVVEYVPTPIVRRAHPIEPWSFYCGDESAPMVVNCTVISGGKLHRTDGQSWITAGILDGDLIQLGDLNDPVNNRRIRVASRTAADITPVRALNVDAVATNAQVRLGRSSGVRAGLIALAPNNAGVYGGPVHPDAGSFPFTTLFTSIDYNGYPAFNHARLNSLNAGNNSGEDGYPNGLLVTAGAFQRGDGYDLTVRGRMKNSASASAFVEFAIEPNHVRGVFNAPGRARLLTGVLGETWSGWLDFSCEMRWRYFKGAGWQVDAVMRWFKPGFGFVFERPMQAVVTAGVNLRTTTALLCHQMRVDNIANLNTYNGTYQGLGTLEIVAQHIELQPVIGNR